MKLFPAKCHERATLRKLWRQTGNSSLLPGQQFTVDCCCKWWLESQRGFQILLLSFVLLYNKPLNDWSLGEQWILFPSNLNVSLDFVSGNIEILGKQNSLFPSGPVIKCLLFSYLLCSELPMKAYPHPPCGGHMVKVLISGLSGMGSSPGLRHCIVFLGKTLYLHSASLHPGV